MAAVGGATDSNTTTAPSPDRAPMNMNTIVDVLQASSTDPPLSLVVVPSDWPSSAMCPPGSAVISVCASNRGKMCTYNGATFSTAVVCVHLPGILDPTATPIMAPYSPPPSFGIFTPVLPGFAPLCPTGTVLTGVCTSGQSRNCAVAPGDMQYSVGWCTAVLPTVAPPPVFGMDPYATWCSPAVTVSSATTSLAGLDNQNWPLGSCPGGRIAIGFCAGGDNVEDCGAEIMHITNRCASPVRAFGNVACAEYGAMVCPANFTYGPWSDWGGDDCENLSRTRTEQCSQFCTEQGVGCTGPRQETEQTKPRPESNCSYTPWAWSGSCGNVSLIRSHSCALPEGCECEGCDEPTEELRVLPDCPEFPPGVVPLSTHRQLEAGAAAGLSVLGFATLALAVLSWRLWHQQRTRTPPPWDQRYSPTHPGPCAVDGAGAGGAMYGAVADGGSPGIAMGVGEGTSLLSSAFGVTQCVVCMDADAVVAMQPCGHRCVCENCAPRFPPQSECPMCRIKVVGRQRIY